MCISLKLTRYLSVTQLCPVYKNRFPRPVRKKKSVTKIFCLDQHERYNCDRHGLFNAANSGIPIVWWCTLDWAWNTLKFVRTVHLSIVDSQRIILCRSCMKNGKRNNCESRISKAHSFRTYNYLSVEWFLFRILIELVRWWPPHDQISLDTKADKSKKKRSLHFIKTSSDVFILRTWGC